MPLPNDVNIFSLIGAGQGLREQQPELALDNLLSGFYIPPRMRTLLMSLLPDLYRRYLTLASQRIDQPQQQTRQGTAPGVIQESITQPGGLSAVPSFSQFLGGYTPAALERLLAGQAFPRTQAAEPFAYRSGGSARRGVL